MIFALFQRILLFLRGTNDTIKMTLEFGVSWILRMLMACSAIYCCCALCSQAAAETGGFEVCGQHATVEMRKPRRGRRERATVPEGTSTRYEMDVLTIKVEKIHQIEQRG